MFAGFNTLQAQQNRIPRVDTARRVVLAGHVHPRATPENDAGAVDPSQTIANVIAEFLADSGDRLVGRMKAAKEPKEAIELAVRSTLCRPPTDEEYKVMGEYLQRRGDRPVPAYQQLVWALITSSEFRFNY